MADLINLAFNVSTVAFDRGRKSLQAFQQNLNGVQTSGQSLAYQLGAGFTRMGMQVAGGTATAMAGVVALTATLQNQFDDLNNLAVAYGYNVTEMSAMKRAADTAGGSLSDFTKATSKVSKELANGGVAFKTLGVNVRDANGNLRTSADLAKEVAEKYTDGSLSTSQMAAAQDVLGKDLDKTAKVIMDVADAQTLANDLQSQGIGIYQEAITASSQFGDVTDKTALILQSMGSIVVARVGPALNTLITQFNDSYTSGGLVRQTFDKIMEGIAFATPGIIDFGVFMAKAFNTATYTAIAAGKAIGGTAAAFAAFVTGDFKGASNILKMVGGDIDELDAANNRLKAGFDAAGASAKKAFSDSFAAPLTLNKGGGGKENRGALGEDKEATKAAKERADVLAQLVSLRGKEAIEVEKQRYTEEERLQLGLETSEQEQARLSLQQRIQEIIAKASPEIKAQAQAIGEETMQLRAKAALMEEERRIKEQIAAIKTNEDQRIKEIQLASKENAVAIKVMSQYGATSDDVRVALTQLAIAESEANAARLRALPTTSANQIALAQEEATVRRLNEQLLAQRDIRSQNAAAQASPSQTANSALGAVGLQLNSLPYMTGEAQSGYQKQYDEIAKLREQSVIDAQEAERRITAVQAKEQDARLTGSASFFGDIASVAGKFGKKGAKIAKTAAIAEATINTYKAATGAYAAMAGIPYVGPALGVAAAAVAVAAGMANVRAIQSQSDGYATGGYTGDGGKYEPAGVVHRGEFVINKEQTKKNRALLERINRGYATGGYVTPLSSSSSPSMSVVSSGSSALTVGSINVTVQGGATNSETGTIVSKQVEAAVRRLANEQILNAKRPGGALYQGLIREH